MLSKELIEKAIDVFFGPEWEAFLAEQPEDVQEELSDLIFDLMFAKGGQDTDTPDPE